MINENTTGVHKQHYKYKKCPTHATLRSDLVVFVVVIVCIFIDAEVLDGFGKKLSCDTQYDITYCQKIDKKQS